MGSTLRAILFGLGQKKKEEAGDGRHSEFTLGTVEDKMRLQTCLSVIFISQIRGENHDGVNMYLIPNLGILENLDPRGRLREGVTMGGGGGQQGREGSLGAILPEFELYFTAVIFKNAREVGQEPFRGDSLQHEI